MSETSHTSKDTTGDRTPIGDRLLPDEIARILGQKIASGALAVGDRLPSERNLCAQFSVSRTVVREALSQLKSDGLVAARAGSGVYVTERDSTNAFRFQNFSASDLNELQDAMELLIPIEVAATRIAAERRTAADLKKIKRALIGMEYAIASDRLGDEEDFQFHQTIVAATHNQHYIALCRHLEVNARHIIRQARRNTKANNAELIDAVQDEHKAIYQALEAGDPDRAARAAEDHLKNATKRMRTYLA